MAQQGRNDNTYSFDELAFWRPIDAENRPVYRAVLRESRAIQDEAQDILNRFAGLSMMGLLPKAQVERLHRDIARWKKQGESTGELRLLMQDGQRRTRMRCDEAMLLYLMHAISDSYARISETDRGALLSASRIAYKRAFAEGNEITRLGAKSVPGAKFVRDTLSNNPLPTGLTYEQALALLLAQCDVVAARMRRDGKKCSCVAVTYRTLDFKTRSHQRAFEDPTDVTDEIFAQVKKLLYECWKCEPLRLIGMALTDLTTDDFRQISLFENPEEREKQKKADEAFDDIRRRFGNGMIVRGSTMSTAGKVARKAKAQMDQDVRIKKEKEK
mgnify:CR=1 FL=1